MDACDERNTHVGRIGSCGRGLASHWRALCTKTLRSRLSASGLVTPSSRKSSTSGSTADMAARASAALPLRPSAASVVAGRTGLPVKIIFICHYYGR